MRKFARIKKWFLMIAATLLGAVYALLCPHAEAAEVDWGPFFYDGRNTEGEDVRKAAGPFYEYREDRMGESLRAIRPFYSYSTHPVRERWRKEYLWPLAAVRGFKHELSWRVLVALGTDFDVRDKDGRYRAWILPIYFQGRDSNGEDYWAVFPLGGSIHEFLVRDEIDFLLFPLWTRHSINNIVTHEWLFPFISRTDGPGVDRFRIFPFYGVANREGIHSKRFIMWPFWTEAHWYREGEAGDGYILFPLWGHTSTEIEETWNFIPPFFRFTRGDKRDLTYAPWPFYQRIKGSNLDRTYLWPFWGRTLREGYSRSFYLWPLGWHEKAQVNELESERKMLLPFYYNYAKRWPAEGGEKEGSPVSKYLKIWPLFSYSYGDGESDFRLLSLWPGRNPGPVERNWAPLWNIYWQSRDQERVQRELLWGVCRYERNGDDERSFTLFPLFSCERDNEERGWSLLNGLAGYRKNGTKRSWRLFYVFEIGDSGD